MPDETPEREAPEPTFHLIPTLIIVGSAVASGVLAGLIKLAIF